MKLLKHLNTVRCHRRAVRKMCVKMGIPLQGLTHDLSKYSLTELRICKYYVGTRSPHEVAREVLGYSPSWIHHKGRNKHHWEYWLDNQDGVDFTPIKMPYKYVVEMFCDIVGAGKTYLKSKWTVESPLQYYLAKCKGQRLMHKDSETLLECLLHSMDDSKTEKDFYSWWRKNKKRIRKEYEERR